MTRPRAGDAVESLAGARRVLVGEAARRLLRRRLDVLLAEGYALGTCRLRRTKLKPGRKLSAYLDVVVRAEEGAPVSLRPVAATWGDGASRGDAAARLEREAARRGLAAPFARLGAEWPEERLGLEVFPLDADFPRLVEMADPARAAAIVPGAPAEPSVGVVRYRPRQRHVLRYDFGAPEDAVYAKLYRGAAWEEGARAAEAAAALAPATSLRPLSVLRDERVVLWRALAGAPLSRGRRSGRRMGGAGALLRALHRPPAAELPARSFDAEARATRRACEHVGALLPEVGARITSLLERAEDLYARLPAEAPTFVHGDVKLDHLWATPGGIVLIDFDAAGTGDPALDVGKLLADLRWRGWPLEQAALQGYGDAPPARLRRARVWEVLWLVKLAARRTSIVDARWDVRVDGLVTEAEALLDAATRRAP